MRVGVALGVAAALLGVVLFARVQLDGEELAAAVSGALGEEAPATTGEKVRVGPLVFTTEPASLPDLPSTHAVGPEDMQPPWPLLSVVADEESIDDPETGIFANDQEHGRAWERDASMSYFTDDGELAFASRVGIRLHGGSTRHRRTQKRVRLYFRSEYGATAFAPGLLFGKESEPVRTVVARTDDQHFATPLAFDISRRIGALAPETKPVRFFLNGQELGQYYLIEHQSRRQWASHFGHEDFELYRYKSNDPIPESFGEIERHARDMKRELSVEWLEERLDLDGLSRHLLSIVYCATNDWVQGTLVRDLRAADSRWKFVNWDMDHSFVDFGASWLQGTRPKWEQEAFELLFSHFDFRKPERPATRIEANDVRKVLFTRLWRDNPEFRARFARLAMDLLNHRLQTDWLLERFHYYRDTLGIPVPAEREDFLRYRADFVRADLQKWFELGELHDVSLTAAPGLAFDVDGYAEETGYRGRYFDGEVLRVALTSETSQGVTGWSVNGAHHPGAVLNLAVTNDLQIEPLLR